MCVYENLQIKTKEGRIQHFVFFFKKCTCWFEAMPRIHLIFFFDSFLLFISPINNIKIVASTLKYSLDNSKVVGLCVGYPTSTITNQ